jgi:PAS domain S-box-containing protein
MAKRESKVSERLRLLESVVVHAKDAIIITQAEHADSDSPKIVYCNAAFCNITGYSEEEVIGRSPRMLQGPDTDQATRAKIRAALAAWKPIEIELLNYKKNGEPFWVELSICPVADSTGWYTHWISVQRDVTERKAAEAVKLRAEFAEAGNQRLQAMAHDLREALNAAEEANRSKSQFLANMSHEIRTPLNGVLGMTQALWADDLTPAQRERVSIIRDSGRALLAVLNDLLDLSKIEAGHLDLELIEFNIEEVAIGVGSVYTEMANRKGVSFGVSLAEDVRGVWLGDSIRIRQILYNLVSNALKFTARGDVKVRLETTQDGQLCISVTDTGVGIPADKVGKLFTNFYQTDSSNTRRFGGTGLGLAICRQLCELMGGAIDVESREGEGSTFRVKLPLKRVAARDCVLNPDGQDYIGAGEPAFVDVAELRVLAAEDNASNQLVLRALMQAFNILPVIVDDGLEAVDAATTQDFDIILMDIQMPTMDGIAATAAIRAWERERSRSPTPIIALSANAMTHQIQTYLATGMDGHVAKPIDIGRLAEVLEKAAELRRQRLQQTAPTGLMSLAG